MDVCCCHSSSSLSSTGLWRQPPRNSGDSENNLDFNDDFALLSDNQQGGTTVDVKIKDLLYPASRELSVITKVWLFNWKCCWYDTETWRMTKTDAQDHLAPHNQQHKCLGKYQNDEPSADEEIKEKMGLGRAHYASCQPVSPGHEGGTLKERGHLISIWQHNLDADTTKYSTAWNYWNQLKEWPRSKAKDKAAHTPSHVTGSEVKKSAIHIILILLYFKRWPLNQTNYHPLTIGCADRETWD